MSRDTNTLHKADQVAAILQARANGSTVEDIRLAEHVSLRFIQNILSDTRLTCPCGRDFFPAKEGQGFGSRDCFFTAVKGLKPTH